MNTTAGNTTDDLREDLRRLGVASGDLLMVHASLRAIGQVAGRADGVIDALRACVGPQGTLMMVLGARNDWDWVNERPEDERVELLRDAVPFDANHTAAESEVGMLAEVFRTRPETVVSNHPEGRFGASGPLAGHLVEAVPWDDYYGPGSPLDRFVESGGRVLRLGADLDTMTVLHFAEYLVPLEPKRRVRRHRVVVMPDRNEVRVVECLDDSNGIVKWNGPDYFGLIVRDYLATAPAPRGMVGHARSELLDARDLGAFAVRWMAQHLVRDRNP